MNGKERMITAIRNKQPDHVPVAPDISNMIPCRLTGKPFWDIYLYEDPPLWKAYINAVKHFGMDGWLYDVPLELEYSRKDKEEIPVWRKAIVERTDERIYTRRHRSVNGKEEWTDWCDVYYIADSPTNKIPIKKLGLPPGSPGEWEDVEPRTHYEGLEAFHEANRMMDGDGVVAKCVGLPGLDVRNTDAIFEYYDEKEKTIARCENLHQNIVQQVQELVKLKSDLIVIGSSGHMISNPELIFRELSLKTLQEATAICKKADVPTQVHCCGPEYDFVKIAAEESDLCSINPLEIPPMGDCVLKQVKQEFGSKIGLMGNLHTTNVMLRGTPDDVREAAKKAIDDAGDNGGFILSTGDQCGRDTPFENIFAMVETAQTYGKY